MFMTYCSLLYYRVIPSYLDAMLLAFYLYTYSLVVFGGFTTGFLLTLGGDSQTFVQRAAMMHIARYCRLHFGSWRRLRQELSTIYVHHIDGQMGRVAEGSWKDRVGPTPSANRNHHFVPSFPSN